ncbi:MAG: exonuclease domain-containing protein [Polynucleobacter sp.]|nr:exonuclease domain-containing protein [Polynucleobacter sp.]
MAIDVETANANVSSICQIGIARYVNGELTEEWGTLVDPEDYFDDMNIMIHGIEPHMVRGQPTLPLVAPRVCELLSDRVSVCHTHFDRIAVTRAFNKYGLSPISTTWLDSARVARRTWKEFAFSGYGLKNVCDKIGYEFKHHDALEDAKAAGAILNAAIRESQLDISCWLSRVNLPIDPSASSRNGVVHRDGNPEGDLYGEVLVFTGALELSRHAAADLAARVGCEVASGVTKKTTILVVGDQDLKMLVGHEKSSKHRKAEELALAGKPIRIIKESDFQELVRSTECP